MRIVGIFVTVASLLGFAVGLASAIPKLLGPLLSSSFGELNKAGGEAVCVLSVCALFLGVKLMTRETSEQNRKSVSCTGPQGGSHLYNK